MVTGTVSLSFCYNAGNISIVYIFGMYLYTGRKLELVLPLKKKFHGYF